MTTNFDSHLSKEDVCSSRHHNPYKRANLAINARSSDLQTGSSIYFRNRSNTLALINTNDIVLAMKNWVSFLVSNNDFPSSNLFETLITASERRDDINADINLSKTIGWFFNIWELSKQMGDFMVEVSSTSDKLLTDKIKDFICSFSSKSVKNCNS